MNTVKDGVLSRRGLIKAGMGAAVAGLIPTSSPVPSNASESGRDGNGIAGRSELGDVRDDRAAVEREPLDYVNVLFGVASLDDPELLGNAPPYGEELYTGMVCPGAALPHGIDVSPVNKDVSLAYPHGNLYSYVYPRRTMAGFSCMVDDMLVMPLVGDWTTPPDRVSTTRRVNGRSLGTIRSICRTTEFM